MSKYGTYYPANYKKFRKEMEPLVKARCRGAFFSGAIKMSVTFYVRRPAKPTNPYPKGDIDNYLKALFDSLNARLMKDDVQITDLGEVRKRYAPPGKPGHIEVVVESVTLD